MNPRVLIDRMSPELQEKVRGRYMVTALSMAFGLPSEDAAAGQNAHLNEISRRDSLSLEDVACLRALAGSWTDEYMTAWRAGFAEGRAVAVLRTLQRRGVGITANTWERVTACTDLAILARWQDLAFTVKNVEELFMAEPGHAQPSAS
ncbi:hypothetical protein ACFQ9Z_12735 [Streptomyces sp. NPDC056580]|uniref:hypothetical protein n=1 Tax=Streptomyces sp. NPDC056580 TaxID=3345872 RepID=UPI0036800E26